MNFKTLLTKLNEERGAKESFVKTGEATRKEAAKAPATDYKAKDAARKRAERAKQVPREKKSPNELVKEVIVVKTKSGHIQLIFKDSYNPDTHTKIYDKDMTLSDARKFVNDPNFEQTRASKLLFGDTKTKEEEKKEKKPKEEEKKEEKTEKKSEGEEQKKEAPKKPRKLSKQEMFNQMGQMTPEQLVTVPLDVRQEYFQALRRPPENREFDHMMSSYEDLTIRFGINPASNVPYNQQVLNALMFLAKLKAGASQQELQTYQIQAPGATEFTRAAFGQAKKILSQLGDQCLNTLLSNIETNTKGVEQAGATDMQCGNYRFKISAGGEIALSTNSFDQSNKSFRGFLAGSLGRILDAKLQNQEDEKVKELRQKIADTSSEFGSVLISKQTLPAILSNKKYVEQLQKEIVKDDNGNEYGPVLDEQGNLNPNADYDILSEKLTALSKDAVKLIKSDKQGFKDPVSSELLKIVLRGDGISQPEMAPNHVITMNGVFALTDNYINELAKTAEIDIQPAKDLISNDNVENYKSSSAMLMKQFRTIVEAKEPKLKEPKLEDMLILKNNIEAQQIIAAGMINKYDFNFNASLLPGFKPKDINSVEYNYVTIGKKTIKIPVITNDQASIKQLMVNECYNFVNDILVESLVNNFVLSSLVKSQLINEIESQVIYDGPVTLLESEEASIINLKTIMENIFDRLYEEPYRLNLFINSLEEESKRDYKKEYRNYHGKPKQRKERAARTRARELMKKKGKVKKGDGKDIDHKNPLRSGGSNGINNLRVRGKSDNRSDNGHKKGEKQNKDWK